MFDYVKGIIMLPMAMYCVENKKQDGGINDHWVSFHAHAQNYVAEWYDDDVEGIVLYTQTLTTVNEGSDGKLQ